MKEFRLDGKRVQQDKDDSYKNKLLGEGECVQHVGVVAAAVLTAGGVLPDVDGVDHIGVVG